MKVIYFGKIADVAKKSSEEINLVENSISGLVAFLQEKYHLDLDDMQIAVKIDYGKNIDSTGLEF